MFSQVSVSPQEDVFPIASMDTPPRTRGRHPPGPEVDTSLGRHPPGQTTPRQTPLADTVWDIVNKQVVCIPLEYIHVHSIVSKDLHPSLYCE